MARVKESEVEKIIDWDSSVSLGPFIQHATVIVTRVEACAIKKGKSLTSSELVEVEKWLAAYYYTFRDSRYTEKKTGDASGKFEIISYKQAAIDSDPSGCLREYFEGKKVGLLWAGKTETEQISYVDRN